MPCSGTPSSLPLLWLSSYRPWGFFLISDSWIYASYAARDKDGIGHNHITRLRVNGGGRMGLPHFP